MYILIIVNVLCSQCALYLAVHVQDTCTGFLLGGIGEMNSKRQPNFLVVNKGEL